jgi:serine/threonine protein kinase
MLAHYEVVSQLGKGGMGEVYLARDTKLGRDVALKLLPPELARDPERLARLRREAKVLASLNHPSIAALYGLEESDGRVCLIMELAEGADLSVRIQGGAIPLSEAMTMALAITEGLEAAHAKGIVHRDLKPANVMLSESGRIKLLDFGLARAFDTDEPGADPAMSPTITSAGMTAAGVILGTAAYMSPEQARGKQIGKQSDIWAFGALFFEMLTGHRLFDGETVSDSIGAILHKDPDWDRLPSDTPPQIIQLLRRCLERDTDRRLRDIGDARVAIADAQHDPTGTSMGLSTAMQAPASGVKPWIAGIAVAVALALGVFGGTQLSPPAVELPHRVLDLGVELLPNSAQSDGIQSVIAPDGSAVAFTHLGQIWLQKLHESEPRPIEGSDGGFAPFWSPDSSEVAWFAQDRLWRSAASGGRATAICELSSRIAGGVGASWGQDGRIWLSTGNESLSSVSARGGQPREELELGEGVGDYHEPHVLPNGDVLFVLHPEGGPPTRLSLLRDGQVRELLDTGGRRATGAVYDLRGFILFRLTGDDVIAGLWAVEYDLDAGEVTGEAFLVEPDAAAASVADDGTVVFVNNPRRTDMGVYSRFRPGSPVGEVIVPAHRGLMDSKVSPDGGTVAFLAEPEDGGTAQLWVRDLERGTESRLTSHDGPTTFPRWSPDGRYIYYSVLDLAASAVLCYRVAPDGSRREEFLGPGFISGVHPDGSKVWMLFGGGTRELSFEGFNDTDVWEVPVDDPEGGQLVMSSDGFTVAAGLSADRRYLLYAQGTVGNVSVYLTRYPEFEGRWKVSLGDHVISGGFTTDGQHIYYATANAIFEVAFTSGESPRLGRPQEVVQLPPGTISNSGAAVDVAWDGDGYLVNHSDDPSSGETESQRRTVKVVQNWTQRLEGR